MRLRSMIFQLAPANNRKSERENALTFPIRSDKGGEVGAAFGVRWAEEMREVRHQLCGPLPTINGEDIWTWPKPSRYVIGQEGMIAYGGDQTK